MLSTKPLTNLENVVATATINQRLYLKSLHKNTLSFSNIFLKKDDEMY